ncbi:MAG: hypothetical protein WCX22_06735 [Methanoregula sp.]
MMDLLPNKLDRLTPEQRREVEDFVDFLIFRSDKQPAPARPVAPVPPVLMATPSPPELASSAPVPPAQPALSYPFHDETVTSPAPQDPEPMHEIGGADDWLTHDYVDLGQYDTPQSPATEAVKKVKRKLIQREEQDKSHHVLDWVD